MTTPPQPPPPFPSTCTACTTPRQIINDISKAQKDIQAAQARQQLLRSQVAAAKEGKEDTVRGTGDRACDGWRLGYVAATTHISII
jgi:hypothetical protein